MSPIGVGLSGGDRIFIELARNFNNLGLKVTIVTWEDGLKMMERQRLNLNNNNSLILLRIGNFNKFGFLINYLIRIFYETK